MSRLCGQIVDLICSWRNQTLTRLQHQTRRVRIHTQLLQQATGEEEEEEEGLLRGLKDSRIEVG